MITKRILFTSMMGSYDRQIPTDKIEYTNENGDALMQALTVRGVDSVGFRDLMIEQGIDWYGAYYKTDHHWKNTTGLWAAGQIVTLLNSDYGFQFDLNKFARDAYDIQAYDNYMFGGQGRAVTFDQAELEPFETDFKLSIPSRSVDKEGDYESLFFDRATFERIADYSKNDFLYKVDAYECFVTKNDDFVEAANLIPNENTGRKILILYDSFGWYAGSYLACDVGKVIEINPAIFDGSIHSLVEQEKPDVVIMMLCEKGIDPVEWNHRSNYDLR